MVIEDMGFRMLFDSHAHYDDNKFDQDRQDVIEKVRQSGVAFIVNAASNIPSSIDSIALSQEYEFIYAAVGVHPQDVEGMNDNVISMLADFAREPKVVAIGEIGLDYHYDDVPKPLQKHWFARQILLARELKLPIIIHDRESHEDILKIVKKEKAKEVGGVFHCFSGSAEMAREVLDNNFYISIGGVATFKNAKKIVDVIRAIPSDRLLIETDSPYLAPEPFRGTRNDSSYIRYTAMKVAEIREDSFENIARITCENAKRLFNIE